MTVRIPPKDLVSTIVMSEYVRKILLSESPIRLYGQTNPTRSMGQNHVGSLRVGGGGGLEELKEGVCLPCPTEIFSKKKI